MVKFGTLEYYKQFADTLNKDEVFSKATGLSTTFAFIFTDLNKSFVWNIENGRIVKTTEEGADPKTEFASTADFATQKGIAKGDIDKTKAKQKFNMMKALKNRSALERVMIVMKELKGVEY